MITLKDRTERYSDEIEQAVRACYDLASRVRKQGKDVVDKVEIPLATDMADRIEELIGISGVAGKIRELSQTLSREEISIDISRKVAEMYKDKGKIFALDKAVRVGLAILTEGILVAPLEGISKVAIEYNNDGSDYVSVLYAGPIRGAGGTAQAMSVLIADIVRRDLGIQKYIPTEDEIERYIEEIQAYNRVKHLQYLPSPEEIRLIIRNSPICIDGEGSEEEEVSGHRDMERVKTNRIRGGMCLVLGEGLIQKYRKILKHTKQLNLTEWNFLENLDSKKSGSGDEEKKAPKKSEKFLKDLVAGRPVFSHPGMPGGFRLRYGRSRVSGLAASSMNPATMYVLGGFIAIGSQLKIELPGKAAAITPCDEVEGPTVLLKDGSLERIDTVKRAREVSDQIDTITDVGEILISYGDFIENNYNLVPSSFTTEWWIEYLKGKDGLERFIRERPDQFEAVEISRKFGIPLHPDYDYLWHDITPDDLKFMRNAAIEGSITGSGLKLPHSDEIRDIMIKLAKPFRKDGDNILVEDYYPLVSTLGLEVDGDSVKGEDVEFSGDVMETINRISGMTIKPRAPTRVGARLGRPEKAGDRKMKPKVHSLFPIENWGDARRSILMAVKNKPEYQVEVASRECQTCGNELPVPVCPKCGGRTVLKGKTKKITVNLAEILRRAEDTTGLKALELKEFKGVKKLMSRNKVAEPLEKGMFRSLHDVSTNKDGTCRYDMTDIPITHFRAEEIGASRDKLVSLGYEDSEMNEIFTQDIIIPNDSAEYLLNVSRYVDDLLMKYYNVEPFYNCRTKEDLIGHLVIGLAPHTSGGIVGRIIGFSGVSGCYAHPFFHAAKRRNCDGDEDSIMLLMDGLLNFSMEYLPSTTGGLMDAPLVLSLKINPEEVDKEAMNLDTLPKYPLEFYEATEKSTPASELETMMKTIKVKLKEEHTYVGTSFTFDTKDISEGIPVSSYKTIGSMEEKIDTQLSLARSIRAVDHDDVAARVLSSHFLPDMYGNFRKFFSQEFRCTKCNTKYRRIPLSGKCLKCGKEGLILTIHRGSIVKYLNSTVKVAEEYKLPWYLMVRIENLVNTIEGTFAVKEEEKKVVLESYWGEEE